MVFVFWCADEPGVEIGYVAEGRVGKKGKSREKKSGNSSPLDTLLGIICNKDLQMLSTRDPIIDHRSVREFAHGIHLHMQYNAE